MQLNWGYGQKFNGMPLMQVTSACSIVHANGGGVVFTLCTSTGGPYLLPLCPCTPWHMRWSEGCWCWTKPTVTCTGGLFFFPKAVAHILNACIVICAVVVKVVAVVVVVVGCNIVTCTV